MKLTLWQILVTCFYTGCYLGVGLVIGSLGPTIPTIATALNTTEADLSAVFFARGGGWLTGSFASGFLYDRVPGHYVLSVAMFFMGLGPFLIPFAIEHGKVPLLSCFTLLGLGGGFVDVGANTLIGWQHGDAVGPHIQFLHFGFALGGVVAPVITAQVLTSSDHGGDEALNVENSLFAVKWTYWALAILCIPFVLIGIKFKSPVRRVAEVGNGEKVPKSVVVLITLLLLFYVSLEIGFGGWVSSYALNLELEDEIVAPYLNSAFWAAIMVGRLAGVPLSSRMSAKTMLLVNMVGSLAASILLAITQPSSIALWVLSTFLGLSLSSVYATAVSYPTTLGMVVAGFDTMWFVIGSSVGEMVLPALFGPIFDALGYEALPYALIILAVLQFVCLLVMFRVLGSRRVVRRLDGDGVPLGEVSVQESSFQLKVPLETYELQHSVSSDGTSIGAINGQRLLDRRGSTSSTESFEDDEPARGLATVGADVKDTGKYSLLH
ncbi:hypothetical protein CAOG_03471 [Capsaspora owczarzaki ATCC 30864]|uniref:Major facilitator superfamily (MFS) profile domain-containing protein n=1 Tax=Capsaspora owczarzaki (strain ATCC 30864) TaxID=595528 RepID=A0A0D2X2G5_CAPO3|nr:hypothetical protein CAOG_03471 [Capsaspora owczarzaki ATCC 30864]KJE92519.1 hypothetical protein CAOG_003471 [Capsaspora owczarzaki ATCC 30864]|eukprot:XP_004348376.1 hypothetical protein CAOG_03471 [Capsaspora owczarzaki ATCC 30864]